MNALMIAAFYGNFEGVKLLVEHGADIYAVNNRGQDAFKYAAIYEYADIMDYLRSKDTLGLYKNPLDVIQRVIENKSTPDNSDNIELEEFYLGALAGVLCDAARDKGRFADMERAFSLMSHIPEEQRSRVINCPDLWGRNPLITASWYGNFDVVKFLVEHGVDIYAKDDSGRDALFLAEQKKYTEIAEYLRSQIEKDQNAKNIEAESAKTQKPDPVVSLRYLASDFWACASSKNRLDDMKSLLESIPEGRRNEVINRPGFLGMNPLMTASIMGNLDGIKFLLEHGANIYAKDTAGKNAYYWAEREGNKDVAEYLQNQMDEDLGAEGAHGSAHDTLNDKTMVSDITPLMTASIMGNLDVVKFLVANGADIYAKDTNGRDALSWAEREGNNDVAEYLRSQIEKDQNAKNIEAENAKTQKLDQVRLKDLANKFWGYASSKDKLDDMKSLLESIPEEQRSEVINHPNSLMGMTPLMMASFSENFEGVKWLVEHGADIYAVDKRGRDAYDLAKRRGRGDVMKYLRSKDTRGKYSSEETPAP